MNNKELQQHQIELFQIAPILSSIGVKEEDCELTDRPDIIIPNYKDRCIGIEVVAYGKGKNKQNVAALDKILNEYAQRIDADSDIHYEVTVFFENLYALQETKFNKHKEQIFEEIERFRHSSVETRQNKFVSKASFNEVKGMKRSIVFSPQVYIYNDLEEDFLMEKIKAKEQKLPNYKKIDRDPPIDEYWLAIYFPTEEATDFEKYIPSAQLKATQFDHIYLTEPSNCKQIK